MALVPWTQTHGMRFVFYLILCLWLWVSLGQPSQPVHHLEGKKHRPIHCVTHDGPFFLDLSFPDL